MTKRKILFFAPHSFVWVHAFPEALVAESLQKSGHEVVYVTCGGLFESYCIPMATAGLKPDSSGEEKKAICRKCRSSARLLREKIGLNGYDLVSRITPEDRERVEKLIFAATPANFNDLELDDVPVGRLAMYEILIKYKKFRLEFSDGEWTHYKSLLKGAALSLCASKRIIDAEKPNTVVSYNTNYSVNGVMSRYAMKRGIKSYCLHAGPNFSDPYRFLMIGERSPYHLRQALLRRWGKYKSQPCSPESLGLVTEFMLELFRGQSVFVYSAPKSSARVDVRERLGAGPDQKILLATLSSYDERFASNFIGNAPSEKGSLFESQVQWVQALIQWVSARPELFLVIRVHPREFPNKRESQRSEHAALIEKALQSLPSNVVANFPQDGLSLYDLAGETSVLLNAWSSVGKEMSALGIPVVLYSRKLLDYPHDLNLLGETEKEYFEKIETALSEGWCLERILKTYRWLAMELSTSLIDIRDSFRRPPPLERDLKSRILRKLDENLPALGYRARNLKERGRGLKPAGVLAKMFSDSAEMPLDIDDQELFPADLGQATERERKALRREMRRLAEALWGASALTDPPHCELHERFQSALSELNSPV